MYVVQTVQSNIFRASPIHTWPHSTPFCHWEYTAFRSFKAHTVSKRLSGRWAEKRRKQPLCTQGLSTLALMVAISQHNLPLNQSVLADGCLHPASNQFQHLLARWGVSASGRARSEFDHQSARAASRGYPTLDAVRPPFPTGAASASPLAARCTGGQCPLPSVWDLTTPSDAIRAVTSPCRHSLHPTSPLCITPTAWPLTFLRRSHSTAMHSGL